MRTVVSKFTSKKGNIYTLVKRGRRDFVITKTRSATKFYTVFGAYENDFEALESFNKLKEKYAKNLS